MTNKYEKKYVARNFKDGGGLRKVMEHPVDILIFEKATPKLFCMGPEAFKPISKPFDSELRSEFRVHSDWDFWM